MVRPLGKVLFSFFIFTFLMIVVGRGKNALAATLYWVGSDGANASVASNWSTTNPTSCGGNVTPSASIPGSSDQMNFDNDCDNSVVVDSGFSSTVSTVVMNSGYAGTVTVSNPLATSSTITISGGTLNGTSSLTAGTSVSPLALFTVSGGTASLENLSSFVDNGGLTVSSGSLTLPNGSDLNGTSSTTGLNITGGTFNAPTGTMTLNGGLTISGSSTFNANGTITFDGGAANLNCNNTNFGSGSFNFTGQTGTKTIGNTSGCTFNIGTNPIVPLGLTMTNSSLVGTGTLTGTSGSIRLNSGASLTGFSGLDTSALNIQGATADFSTYSPFIMRSSFSLGSGTFTPPTTMIDSGTNFTYTGGTFNTNNGTVIWSGTGTLTVALTSNLTLNNVTKTNAGTILFIANPSVLTIAGTLTLQGTSGSNILLHSFTSPTVWNINATGGRNLSFLDVQDSTNTNSDAMVAYNSTNSGNNTNWTFTSDPVISFSLDSPGGDSHITNTRPTFRWKKASPSINSSMTKYQLFVDNGDMGDFNIDGIAPSVNDNNGTREYDNYTLYDDGSYLNLTTKSSALWNNTQNNGELTFCKKNWRIVAHDSVGNTREESVDFWVDSPATPMPTATPIVYYSTFNGTIEVTPSPAPSVQQTTAPISTATPVTTSTETTNTTHKNVLASIGDFFSRIFGGVKNSIANLAFVIGTRLQGVSNNLGYAIVKFGYLFVNGKTQITNVQVAVLSPTEAKVTWETNHPANGKVNYGLDRTYKLEAQSERLTTSHEFVLKGLTPNTEYFFEVMSQNNYYVFDADRSFKTPSK